MKKFRLIREYPGSPKLGTFIENFEINPKYYRVFGDVVNLFTKNIENHPEFWEEVIEKDYGILQKEYIPGNCREYNTEQSQYKIISIKRLSDGEIFTVGDILDNGNILKEFELINNVLKCWYINPSYYTHIKKGPNGQPGNMNWDAIIDIQKLKQPILTTEDGVNIYEGDEVTWLYSTNLEIAGTRKADSTMNKSLKYFLTKEKAEEYILMNKPCLSLNDIFKIMQDDRSDESFTHSKLGKIFKELGKSKQ